MNFRTGPVLLLLGCLVVLIICSSLSSSVTAISIGNPSFEKTFYLTGTSASPLMTFSKKLGLATNGTSPLPGKFVFPPIYGPGASIVGGAPVTLALWLSANDTTSATIQPRLQQAGGSFDLIGGAPINLTQTIKQYNLTYTMSGTMPLRPGFQATLNFSYIALHPKTSVTIYWGLLSPPSRVDLPFANFAVVQSVKITDYRGAENQTFNVQAPPNQNIVFLTSTVFDVFGFGTDGDIAFVNMTITGPAGPIRGPNCTNHTDCTNSSMSQFCPLPCLQEAQYQGYWVYPAGTVESTYSVTINAVDLQGNVISDTSGLHSFGIGPLPPPFPYLAAAVTGGGLGIAGLATGAVYLRRRRTREYLAPFAYFDQLTGGEVPGGSMVTVEGNTGAGKTTLCSEIMYEDLKRGRPCIYVAADDFPDRIRDQMRNLGIDVSGYEKTGLLSFVDCYSAEAGRTPTEKFSVPSMGDLTTLGVKISSALQDQKGTCLYMDSLSPLVSRTKPESIVSFVHAIGAKVRGLDGKAFFTMSTGTDETIQRQLEDMADCVVQMEAFEEKDVRRRRLRVRKFRNRKHQEGWATFTIEDGKGIIFYTRQSRGPN